MTDHPVRLTVAEDLRRSRLTVFFRLLLVIPHGIWLGLWTVAALVAGVASWLVTLAAGRPPSALHGFLAAYVRYALHVHAYLFLAANPFPAFTGAAGSYPVDVELPGPERQRRWVTALRLPLAIPALAVAGTLLGYGGPGSGGRSSGGVSFGGVATTASFLTWFAALATGRAPRGLRNLILYGLGYAAQTYAYLFMLTDRYPYSGPEAHVAAEPHAPPHPIRLAVADDLRRSRLTVLFRALLALPHLVWLALWSVAALLAAIANWIATLAAGRPPAALHRFLAAFLRYQTHVSAFLFLAGNPFPGFTGGAGSYPVDLELAGPERQRRWTTALRILLALPALMVASSLSSLLATAAFLGWFAALVTGRMPRGLRNAQAYALRYAAQAYGYLLVLTDRYPYAGPEAGTALPSPPAEPQAVAA